MKIVQTIGKVTLSRCHPALKGGRWVVGVPLSIESLTDLTQGRDEPFVIYDELGPNNQAALIAVSEGAEAVAPFHPEVKPIDAYNAAILDAIELG